MIAEQECGMGRMGFNPRRRWLAAAIVRQSMSDAYPHVSIRAAAGWRRRLGRGMGATSPQRFQSAPPLVGGGDPRTGQALRMFPEFQSAPPLVGGGDLWHPELLCPAVSFNPRRRWLAAAILERGLRVG